MRQPSRWKRKLWFWVGVVLLSSSTLFWLLLIPAIVKDPHLGGIIVFMLLTAPPISIGIYGVRRGLRPQVKEETGSAQVVAGEDPQVLLRQKERTVATLKATQFGRLSWLIVITFPILAIMVALVFSIIDLSVWLLILTLLVAFVITLLLLSLISKHQASYYKKSVPGDMLRKWWNISTDN